MIKLKKKASKSADPLWIPPDAQHLRRPDREKYLAWELFREKWKVVLQQGGAWDAKEVYLQCTEIAQMILAQEGPGEPPR